MNWLSDNYKWLFDGVVGTAAIGIIGFIFGRLFSPERSHAIDNRATLTASPHIEQHVHIATAAQTPAVAERPATDLEPVAESARAKPNIKIIGCKKILVHTGLDGAFYKSEEGRALGEAVVANVTNDVRRESANIGAIIKAVIIYQIAGEELLRGMGCWLSEGSGMVQFHVDDSHSVVLGVVMNGQFSVPTKRKVLNGIDDVSFPTDRNLLDCDRATVMIRLTNADTGDLYCEEQFEVATNPLSISGQQ